jgi:hypothetical protein
VNVRGRLYKQTGALLWSDVYTGGNPPLGPKGTYWTGDRELSPFYSALVGLRVSYVMTPQQDRKILGFLQEVKLGFSLDLLQFFYEEYTLPAPPPRPGQTAGNGGIDNARAFIGGGNVGAAF